MSLSEGSQVHTQTNRLLSYTQPRLHSPAELLSRSSPMDNSGCCSISRHIAYLHTLIAGAVRDITDELLLNNCFLPFNHLGNFSPEVPHRTHKGHNNCVVCKVTMVCLKSDFSCLCSMSPCLCKAGTCHASMMDGLYVMHLSGPWSHDVPSHVFELTEMVGFED